MAHSSIKQELDRQLDHLPLELQRRVLDFAQALVQSLPKGVHGKELIRFAGVLDAEDAQAIAQAIESGCEQVDMGDQHDLTLITRDDHFGEVADLDLEKW